MRYLVWLLLVCSVFVSADWQVEDLLKVRDIADVDLSPDGSKLLYTVRSPHVEEHVSEYVCEIWATSCDGSDSRLFAKGKRGRWSPDGKWIAFLADKEGKASLRLISTTGGESRELTPPTTEVRDYLWRPDSQAIAVVAAAPLGESIVKRQARREDVRVVDRERPRYDLWLIDLSGQARLVLESDDCLSAPSGMYRRLGGLDWSPDGTKIAITRQPTPSVNDFCRSGIDLVDVESGKCTPLVRKMTAAANPRFSPDGQWIAFSAGTPEFPTSFTSRAYLVSASGAEFVPLAPTPDEALDMYAGPLGWSSDGQFLYALESKGTVAQFYQIPVDGNAVQPITLDDAVLGACFSVAVPLRPNPAGLLPGVSQDFTHPPEAALIDTGAKRVTRVSRQNSQLSAGEFGRSEVIRWKMADGFEIEGILTYPLHGQEGIASPLVVMVHGGPMGVWQQHFLRAGHAAVYPVTAFSAAGYAVLQPNPRGSHGYGRAFRWANRQDWGGDDFLDLLLGVIHVIQMGVADSGRLGILGWSYGGYMTAWAMSQTGHFKAGAMGNGLTDLMSMAGTCDVPDSLFDFFGETWEKRDLLIERSPFYRSNCILQPLLIMHGEKDERVPPSQSWELYTALKRRGCPVEFVLYPRTPHSPNEPKLCLDIASRQLNWFNRYLKRGSPQPDKRSE
jgi:dipeptidyl aminopeptidase/acylaminoacyl peptidase